MEADSALLIESINKCIEIISNDDICDSEDIILSRLESILFFIGNCDNLSYKVELEKCLQNGIDLINAKIHSNLRVGRPKLYIPPDQIEHLITMNFKVSEIASMFGVHKSTIKNRMKEAYLSVNLSYTVISDDELATLMSNFLANFPNTGYKRMTGYLISSGIKLKQLRIREMMRSIDPIGVTQRKQRKDKTIKRREYYVKYSNQMWHIDANLKLIRWGFVIRCGIDGKSRTAIYLEASNNNRADTHLLQFMKGVSNFGVPYRTRTDKGGENVLIAKFMIDTRGTGRNSHICGRSVHNQRIERFWRDLAEGCTTFYRNVFNTMENEGLLDIDNPKHLEALHYVFLPRLNHHLQMFREGWNNHPLSTEGNKTPSQLFLLNMPPAEYEMDIPEEDLEEMYFNCNSLEDLEQFHERREDITGDSIFEDLGELNNDYNINPLRDSNDFGVDVYLEVLNKM